jgi:signal transduction histidine kinase
MISAFPKKQSQSALPSAKEKTRDAVLPPVGELPWLACEIHDGFVQDAFAAKMLLESLLQTGRFSEEETRAQVQCAADLMEKALRETRRLIGGMRLAALEELGVVKAIEALIADMPPGAPTIRFVADVPPERWDAAREVAVYRIVQQSLQNIRRHSRAKSAEVRLCCAGECLHLEIEDRGIGFDPAGVQEDRFGLQGIRQRARLLGGRATIESAPGKGTRIVVELPAARP